MTNYYVVLQTKSQAFLLEQRIAHQGIKCELVSMPREIMKDLCNMGVRFKEDAYPKAVQVIKNRGLPGCKLYKETIFSNRRKCEEISL